MSAPTLLPSIQGEFGDSVTHAAEKATAQDVDMYVDTHSPELVACRMERRHPYAMPRGIADFTDTDEFGNFLAFYTCTRCGCAVRREVWMGVKYGREVRWERISATTTYQKNKLGETYEMPPGTGRADPVKFRNSVVTATMQNQSPAALKKAIQKMKKRNNADPE